MTAQKYIVVIPCIFLDAIYLAEVDGVVRPDYFDSEQAAESEIKDYEESYGDGDNHFPMLVTVDTAASSILDTYGYDWAVNLHSQATEASIW